MYYTSPRMKNFFIAHLSSKQRENMLFKKIVVILLLCSFATMMFVACGGSSGGDTTFTQQSVTISKGSSLNLINDVAVTHIIGNGSWVNGTAKPATEAGAPTVSNLQFNSAGQSQTVGPFNTAGTYHLYCSIHQEMNLTVIVQ